MVGTGKDEKVERRVFHIVGPMSKDKTRMVEEGVAWMLSRTQEVSTGLGAHLHIVEKPYDEVRWQMEAHTVKADPVRRLLFGIRGCEETEEAARRRIHEALEQVRKLLKLLD